MCFRFDAKIAAIYSRARPVMDLAYYDSMKFTHSNLLSLSPINNAASSNARMVPLWSRTMRVVLVKSYSLWHGRLSAAQAKHQPGV